MKLKLVERDYEIFREVERWRFCLGRHIKVLAGFSGQRACDRRLRALLGAGYIDREKIVYGVPSVYRVAYRAKMMIGANKRQDKIRLDNIAHDIAVIDTAIYMCGRLGIPFRDITTEKQLHSQDGFSNRNHQPDFTFTKGDKTTCVEVELSLKSQERLNKTCKANFIAYDCQIWVIENTDTKLYRILEDNKTRYPNIEIINMEEVKKHVRKNH